ncbi:MarR family transcriptional regulator [Lysinibacillus telephonicus]|uniref:MarR family transcriptional regulator n=1 Tax=Lysinibacillus telephonicus TaxID=1714840 RepID=A0A3S0HKF0_9BACI|nr:MarR family transcriptional regulator [Lysinibacillus telephonicus]RTQ94506.1 MarR family transcriptional regulator [Lysinibacillus telephonicus]
MNLFTTIYRFNKLYVLKLQEICSPFGITPVQWLVIHHIYNNEGCTSMDIVKEWSVEKPTVSSLVKKLHEQGLIQFKSGADKRQKYLSLSQEGQVLCGKVKEKVMNLQSFVTEPFSEEMVNEWSQQLAILEERMLNYEG